jgi:hypothetical protein
LRQPLHPDDLAESAEFRVAGDQDRFVFLGQRGGKGVSIGNLVIMPNVLEWARTHSLRRVANRRDARPYLSTRRFSPKKDHVKYGRQNDD